MGSGYYPLERDRDSGAKLAAIESDLHRLINSRGDNHGLPAAWDNDQYDNAASDGGYETYLELALELIGRCLTPKKAL